jgi:dipeptidyl aminopeptidase/acylaminoacyl peptidase
VNGTEKLLTPHDGPGNFGNGLFSLDGRTIFLTSDQDRENIAFARVMLDANNQPGPIQVIVERNAQLQEFKITHDGKTAALVWNVAGRCELAFCDLDTFQVSAGPALPFELIYDLTFSVDDRLLAFTATGSVSPRNIWLLDRETGQMRQVTHSPHAGVNLERLVMPRLVKFKAHDGLELSGWLYLPRDFSAPGPVVLSFHGGPEAQERPAFDATYQALLARGIAVLAPNVRGSGGFGKTFVNLDNGALRVNAVRDIESCATYLISEGIAAQKRIGIMGGSYGGYMTMAGLAAYPDLFAAGTNLFGVVNFKTFFAQTEPWMAAISKVEYGDPDTEGEMLDRLSPINQLGQVKAPTLVLHGANDTNVPVIEAEQVVEGLKRQGIPTEYILFSDEGHGFQKEPNRIAATVAIVEWFVKYLSA